MNVMEVIALHSGAEDILAAYGLHCFQCAFNQLDSIEAGARTHGLDNVDIENLVTDLQELIDAAPLRPQMITLTLAAAQALLAIGKQEKKKNMRLRVESDSSGSFCMEFDDRIKPSDHSFTCATVKGVEVLATDATLWHIGGSAIDFREGTFKLDLGGSGACGCPEEACRCKQIT